MSIKEEVYIIDGTEVIAKSAFHKGLWLSSTVLINLDVEVGGLDLIQFIEELGTLVVEFSK